jgi:hemolysin III
VSLSSNLALRWSRISCMHKLFTAPKREQTRSEELANSISHGLGLVGAVLGATYLVIQAARNGKLPFIISASVFGTAMVALYFLSTLYHALPNGKTKQLFRAIEQAAIFVFIASTYTPFTLGVLYGYWGWALFFVIWSLATLGVALLFLDKLSRPIAYNSLYLLMGWLIAIAFGPILAKVPLTGVQLLIAGGLTYTVGVFFQATDSVIRYGHFVWHLCVIGGTSCHYFAVLWYAA